MASTRRLTIKEKSPRHVFGQVKPANFIWEAGAEIAPETVLADPRFTLYCFDRERDTALFVECPDPKVIDKAPFYYSAQFEQAIGLVSMPLSTFQSVGVGISEPPKGVIFIHSVGRCGSTLLSKALEAVPSVHSLSEPDDLSQLQLMRDDQGVPDTWIRDLIPSAVRWRCKPRLGAPADFVAIKTRARVVGIGDLLYPHFTHAKHLFMYRNCIPWTRSRSIGFASTEFGLPVTETVLTNADLTATAQKWVNYIESYFRMVDLGMPPFAVRFEDLIRDPIPMLKHIFSYVGIEDADWGKITEVLGRDSQAGTLFDREGRSKLTLNLTDDQIQFVTDLAAKSPRIGTPDPMLVGTVCL